MKFYARNDFPAWKALFHGPLEAASTEEPSQVQLAPATGRLGSAWPRGSPSTPRAP